MLIKNSLFRIYLLLLLIAMINTPSVWAASRNQISIEPTFERQGHFDPIIISDWKHEIAIPIDTATGQLAGRRQHSPFVITTPINALPPLLYQALVNNENLSSLVVRIFTIDGKVNTLALTIKLTNAKVIKVGKNFTDNKIGLSETAEFVYEKIEWADATTGITSEDNWGGVR